MAGTRRSQVPAQPRCRPGPRCKTARVRVLVADDEPAVRSSLDRALTFEGYEVALAGTGREALEALGAGDVDAVVLDIMMPDLDGVETCRRIRSDGNRVSILMLTAKDAVADRVAALDGGADDYLVKPFALEELLARLRALLRRTTPATSPAEGVLRFADLSLDTRTREVRRGDRAIDLTKMEWSLLELFMRNPRQVLSRPLIMDRIWGYDFGGNYSSLEVYVGYLRRKTEADGESRLLHTVRGVGYVLREAAT